MRMRVMPLILIVLLLIFMGSGVVAETAPPISPHLSVVTDKTTYAKGDEILVTMRLQNESSYPIRNAVIQLVVPNGFVIKSGYRSSISAESVSDTPLTLTTRLVALQMPKTGDNTPVTILILLISFGFTILLIAAFQNARARKLFCLIFCFILGSGYLPINIAQATTSTSPQHLSASQSFQYGKQSFTVKANASFDQIANLKVVFNPNYEGAIGEMPFIYVPVGNTVDRPQPDPVREGYILVGWYVNPSCTEMFLFNDERIVQDTTLYAGWIPASDDQRFLDAAFSLLQIGYAEGNNSDCVTQDIYLPLEVDVEGNKMPVQWRSNMDDVLSASGAVFRPKTDQQVTLTAVITYAELSTEKVFVLRVCQENTVDTSAIPEPTLTQIAAQSIMDIEVDFTDYGTMRWLHGEFYDEPISSPDDAIVSLYSIKTLLGMNEPKQELAPEISTISDVGSVFRLKQMYNGIPVYGRSVIVSTDNGGYTVAVQSNYLDNLSLSVSPGFNATQAINYIKQGYVSAEILGDVELAVYSLDEFLMSPILVYYANIGGESGYHRVIVDATTGVKIKSYSGEVNLHSGRDELGEKRTFPAVCKIDNYYLMDNQRGISAHRANGLIESKWLILSWDNPVAISAYANLIDVYDWWLSNFSLKSFDGKGKPLKVYFNVIGKDSNDNDLYDNAAWLYDLDVIRFYQKKKYPYTTAAAIDVAAHEYAHAVMDYAAGRTEASGIIGAISEAYADIFANFIDPDWTIAELLSPNQIRRRIDNPLLCNNPTRVNGQFYVALGDTRFTHTNSTVVSHAMYLMNRYGISMSRLAKLWFQSMKEKYTNNAEWIDVRRNVLLAARKLNYNSSDVTIIKRAFDDVGILDGNDYVTNWPTDWPMVITGSNIGLRLSINKLQVKPGDTITATWTVNKGTPPYQVEDVLWVIIDQNNQIVWQQKALGSYLGNNRWTSSFSPPREYSGSCAVYMKDAAGKQDGVALRYLIQP